MTGSDGFELVRRIREHTGEKGGDGKRVPIVLFSADAMKGNGEKAAAAGADAFLSKPIDIPKLFRTVQKLLPASSERSMVRKDNP